MSLTDSKNIVIPSVIVLAILGIISFFPSDDPSIAKTAVNTETRTELIIVER